MGVTWLIALRWRKGNSIMGIRFFNLRRSRVRKKNIGRKLSPLHPPPNHAYDRHRGICSSGVVAPLKRNLSTKLWGVTRVTLLPLYSRTKRSVSPGRLKFWEKGQTCYFCRWSNSDCSYCTAYVITVHVNVLSVPIRKFALLWSILGASGGAFGLRPMLSLEFLIDIILPALGSTQALTEMSTRKISWSKRDRCVGLKNLPPSCADCLAMWKTQSPGALRPCLGLYKDYFTFTCKVLIHSFIH